MSALFKSSILLVLALAAAIGLYLYGSLSGEDAARVAEAPIAPVVPATQEELEDYLLAQHIGSLEGWREFLAAHGRGPYAQSARTEVEKLLHAETPALAAAEVSSGASPDAQATSEAARPAAPSEVAPSPATEVAPSTPDEICIRDDERLGRLRNNPTRDEAARFANELGCEKVRPQLLRLMESLGYAPASASQSPSVTGCSARGPEAASDCVSEQNRLDRIRAQPSADAAQQFWRDLRCDRLRPQVRLLLESFNLAADPPTACRREAEELTRIRTNPNRREAESFARDMTCDALKPQAARLLESLAE